MVVAATPTLIDVLTFEVAGRQFGIAARDVYEVVRAVTPVPLPCAPSVVEGVINLRGAVIPIFNLRARLQLPSEGMRYSDQLIIARSDQRTVAVHVDRVLELMQLDASEIENVANIVPGIEHVAFLARLPESLLLIHDLATFLSKSEAAALNEALATSSNSE